MLMFLSFNTEKHYSVCLNVILHGAETYTTITVEAGTTTGLERTVVYERLPAEAGVNFTNRPPITIKIDQRPRCLKLVLNSFLVSNSFYDIDEVWANNWETVA